MEKDGDMEEDLSNVQKNFENAAKTEGMHKKTTVAHPRHCQEESSQETRKSQCRTIGEMQLGAGEKEGKWKTREDQENRIEFFWKKGNQQFTEDGRRDHNGPQVTRCFQERFMGTWKVVKLVFLRKPDAAPTKGIRSYRATVLLSVMSSGTSCQHLQAMITNVRNTGNGRRKKSCDETRNGGKTNDVRGKVGC